MSETIEAVYKHGALHPLKPLKGLKENARVRVTVEPSSTAPHSLERFAGSLSAEEAEEMLRLVDEEFEQVEPDAW
jgi:predicted DNA-binding antitoxin AbrB/MazE fold protein